MEFADPLENYQPDLFGNKIFNQDCDQPIKLEVAQLHKPDPANLEKEIK